MASVIDGSDDRSSDFDDDDISIDDDEGGMIELSGKLMSH